MAAHSEHTNGFTGIKKVLGDAVSTLQTRVKDAEKIWSGTTSQINARIHTVEKDVRELAGKVESDSRKHFEALKGQLKFDELKDRIKPSEMLGQGARLTREAIDKLDLPTREDVEALAKKVEQLAKGTKGAPAVSKEMQAFDKRLTAIETALKSLEKKLDSATKAAAPKATATKATAKKAAAPKKTTKAAEAKS